MKDGEIDKAKTNVLFNRMADLHELDWDVMTPEELAAVEEELDLISEELDKREWAAFRRGGEESPGYGFTEGGPFRM